MNKKLSFGRRAYIYGMKALMYASIAAIGALVLFLIGYVLYRGIPNITWKFLTTAPSILNDTIGIWPDILNSIYVVIATIIIVLPLGVCAAVYLSEYASNKKLVRVIEYAAETLSGIPSIIYGLVGMLFFCEFLKMQTSLMARRRVRPWRGQMEGNTHGGAAGLRRRRYNRLYTVCRPNTRRIGRAAFHGRHSARGERLLHGA